MHSRTIATALMLTACTSVTALAQTFDPSSMKTPDGQPDISGRFTFRTLTPLQRPQALEGKSALDAEEAAQFEASERNRLNRDLFDPESGAPSAGYQPRADGGVLSYNEFWYERGIELVADKRTSLIIDPPNGRLPEQTPAARRRSAARRAYVNEHRYDSLSSMKWFITHVSFQSVTILRNHLLSSIPVSLVATTRATHSWLKQPSFEVDRVGEQARTCI